MSKEDTYVFDDWLPAALIVDLVTVPGCVDDVQLQPDTVLSDDWSISTHF